MTEMFVGNLQMLPMAFIVSSSLDESLSEITFKFGGTQHSGYGTELTYVKLLVFFGPFPSS